MQQAKKYADPKTKNLSNKSFVENHSLLFAGIKNETIAYKITDVYSWN
jgi:hypothetical protein